MPPAAAPTLTRRALAAPGPRRGAEPRWGRGGLGPGAAADDADVRRARARASTVPATTAPPATTTTEAPGLRRRAATGCLDLDANEKVWVIVGGLVAIAVLMMVLTVIYWRHTKPDRPKQDKPDRPGRAPGGQGRAQAGEARAPLEDSGIPSSPTTRTRPRMRPTPRRPRGRSTSTSCWARPTRPVRSSAEPDEDDEPGR